QIEIVVGAVRLECYRGAVLIFGQSALVLIAIEVAERGMGRRVFRIDLEDLHELDLRVARLMLKYVEISERDLGARIVRLELHRLLVSLFSVGELRRLHIGVALGQKILGGLAMASRGYQDHHSSHRHRPGPGQQASLPVHRRGFLQDQQASDWAMIGPATEKSTDHVEASAETVSSIPAPVAVPVGCARLLGYKDTPCALSSSQPSNSNSPRPGSRRCCHPASAVRWPKRCFATCWRPRLAQPPPTTSRW